MRKLLAVLILAASCLTACSKPRIEASSASALKTSTKKVAESLSGKDAERFKAAMGLIDATALWERNPAWFARALALGPTPLSPPSGGVMERVHGLTANEVIALADRLAAETQRIHGLTADDVIALAHKLRRIAAEAKAREDAARAAYERAAQVQRAEEGVARAIEAAYFPRVEIRSLKAAYFPRIEVINGSSKAEKGSRPPLGGAFARVDGEVKNLGDKTLDKVELTFTLLDAGGKPLAGHSHLVVLIKFDHDGALAPFKPRDARGFSRIINNPPKEWAGKAQARITAVKFAEPK